MKLIKIQSTQDIRDFHSVPFRVYKNDSNWIPHIKQDIEKIFSTKKNKFFSHGSACRWVLKKDAVLIGRVAAFIDNRSANTFNQPTGGMGFFECPNNKDAAFLLFDTCKNWLKERGMAAMDGPINFGEKNQFWGLLTTNFKSPNTYGMNYNPEYYKTLFELYGFQPYYKQFLFKLSITTPLQKKIRERSLKIEEDSRFSFSSVKKNNLAKFAEDFRVIYNGAWAQHDNFKEMTKTQSLKILNKLKPIMDEDVMFFAYFKNNPVAFYISIPELNEVFKYVNGNLNWWGKLKFLFHLKRGAVKTLYSIVFGVVKPFQGKGIDSAIINYSQKSMMNKGRYKDAVLTWIGDFNPKMLSVVSALGAKKFRTLTTYRKLFSETAVFERCPIIE